MPTTVLTTLDFQFNRSIGVQKLGNYGSFFNLQNTCPIVKRELFHMDSSNNMVAYTKSDVTIDQNGDLFTTTTDFFTKTLYLKVTDIVGAFSTKQF